MQRRNLKKYSRLFREYTELRLQDNREMVIGIVNGNIVNNITRSHSGISARVYKNGVWGFASQPDWSEKSIKKMIETATHNAVFLGIREKKLHKELPTNSMQIETDYTTNKKVRSQHERLQFLRDLDAWIEEKFPDLQSRSLHLHCLDMEKDLITSDGAITYSMIPRTLIYVSLSKHKNGTPFDLFHSLGGFGQFEDNFDDWNDLKPEIEKLYDQLIQKTNGVFPDAGRKECVLAADLAGILAHEAIGHTTEADGVLAGSIAAEFLNKQVASPLVTLVDFAHSYNGNLCPIPVFVDDEGTKAKDSIIIKEGVLNSFMHNKESALHFGVEPTGNARAYGFDDEPLIRMRNTAILPGKSNLETMIESIDDGYYLVKSSNGQADSTSEFMFGITFGYEIKNGKIGRAIKDTTISGVAFDVLKTVSMVSNEMSWECAGFCGKKQRIPVSMGGPAIKCQINIGGK